MNDPQASVAVARPGDTVLIVAPTVTPEQAQRILESFRERVGDGIKVALLGGGVQSVVVCQDEGRPMTDEEKAAKAAQDACPHPHWHQPLGGSLFVCQACGRREAVPFFPGEPGDYP